MTDDGFDEIMLRRNGAMLIATVAVPADGAPHADSTDDVERSGCMVGFATQCSIDPRRFLLCLSMTNHTTSRAGQTGYVGVHAVPADRFDLAELFGGTTGDDPGVDKLAEVPWRGGPHGVPLLDDCPDRFVGRVIDRLTLGDHIGYVLEPVEAEVEESGTQDDYLHLERAESISPGHEA